MAWTQADIDALKESIKSGHTEVSFRDRTVKYRSVTEMIQLLRMLENEVDAKTLKSTQILASSSKGLDS